MTSKITIVTDYCLEHKRLKCIYPNGDNFTFTMRVDKSLLDCSMSENKAKNDHYASVMSDWIRCSYEDDNDELFDRLEEIALQVSTGEQLIALMSLFIINAN